MIQKILYTKREAAALLSISTGMLDNLIAHRRLLVRRLGRRVLVSMTELERFAGVECMRPEVAASEEANA
jgi:excisionase family DNA binding protein